MDNSACSPARRSTERSHKNLFARGAYRREQLLLYTPVWQRLYNEMEVAQRESTTDASMLTLLLLGELITNFLQGLGLVFVAVYQRSLKLLYVEELLERVKQEFSPQYKPDQVSKLVSWLQ